MHIRRSIVFGALVAAVLAASPVAVAQTAPKPGASCAMSGMAVTVKKVSFVCQRKGDALRWSEGLPVSTSPLKAKDTWAKAAESGMTAVFGTITNPTNRDVRVIAATTPFGPTQIHQVVMVDGAMKMTEKPGGLVIPARGSAELKPGADHLMLMQLSKPIKAGTRVPVTLITSTGATMTFNAMGKPFSGGNESYDENHGGHGSGMAMN